MHSFHGASTTASAIIDDAENEETASSGNIPVKQIQENKDGYKLNDIDRFERLVDEEDDDDYGNAAANNESTSTILTSNAAAVVAQFEVPNVDSPQERHCFEYSSKTFPHNHDKKKYKRRRKKSASSSSTTTTSSPSSSPTSSRKTKKTRGGNNERRRVHDDDSVSTTNNISQHRRPCRNSRNQKATNTTMIVELVEFLTSDSEHKRNEYMNEFLAEKES